MRHSADDLEADGYEAINQYLLCPVCQESFNSAMGGSLNAIVFQFPEQGLIGDTIESFEEIQYDEIKLIFLV